MSLLSRLFGKSSAPKAAAATAEEYKGFRIYPEPVKEAGGYRVSARIEKDVNGELLTHQMIRADTIQSQDEAVSITVGKAKQMIDQMGERLF